MRQFLSLVISDHQQYSSGLIELGLISAKVFSLSGNQVKSLWPLVPLSRAEICQEGLCDVETLLNHRLQSD